MVRLVIEQVSVAGYTAGERAKHVPRGKYVAGASILVGTGITMFVLVVLHVFPFTPRYIIPVAGMMVGNAMTVTGVTMKKLRDDIKIQMNLVWNWFASMQSQILIRVDLVRVGCDVYTGGDCSSFRGNATTSNVATGETVAGDSPVSGAGQCKDSGANIAARGNDGADNGRGVAS